MNVVIIFTSKHSTGSGNVQLLTFSHFVFNSPLYSVTQFDIYKVGNTNEVYTCRHGLA